MKRTLLLGLACACACPSKPSPQGAGASGSGLGRCEDVRTKVEQLYRSEAQAKEPKRVEEAVADNTAMVLHDCAKAPDAVISCLHTATSVIELERACLAAIDDEGSEGDVLKN